MSAVSVMAGVQEGGEVSSEGFVDNNTTATSKPHDESERPIQHEEATESRTETSSNNDEATLQGSLYDTMSDWSETGRGTHVDFDPGEVVPLQEVRFLGQGGIAFVYETKVRGHRLAWKKMGLRRKPGLKEKREIEILKKLSHAHMIRLMGTYTHQRVLGLLLHPVAICDLHTFFDDAEAYWGNTTDESQLERLKQVGYFPDPLQTLKHKAWPIYSQIGCLISAVAYLHGQSIRHKDLNPSNILLSCGRLYLSDFGNATDFSMLSQSATGNGGGTPMYFSPETARYHDSGRAADVFSLGCVLLEILVFHHESTLQRIRHDQPDTNPAYHANLHKLDTWLPWAANPSPRRHHLIREVRMMLLENPDQRPIVEEVLSRTSLCDAMINEPKTSIFGDCCRTSYVTATYHLAQLGAVQTDLQHTRNALKESERSAVRSRQEFVDVIQTLKATQEDRDRLVRERQELETKLQTRHRVNSEREILFKQNLERLFNTETHLRAAELRITAYRKVVVEMEESVNSLTGNEPQSVRRLPDPIQVWDEETSDAQDKEKAHHPLQVQSFQGAEQSRESVDSTMSISANESALHTSYSTSSVAAEADPSTSVAYLSSPVFDTDGNPPESPDAPYRRRRVSMRVGEKLQQGYQAEESPDTIRKTKEVSTEKLKAPINSYMRRSKDASYGIGPAQQSGRRTTRDHTARDDDVLAGPSRSRPTAATRKTRLSHVDYRYPEEVIPVLPAHREDRRVTRPPAPMHERSYRSPRRDDSPTDRASAATATPRAIERSETQNLHHRTVDKRHTHNGSQTLPRTQSLDLVRILSTAPQIDDPLYPTRSPHNPQFVSTSILNSSDTEGESAMGTILRFNRGARSGPATHLNSTRLNDVLQKRIRFQVANDDVHGDTHDFYNSFEPADVGAHRTGSRSNGKVTNIFQQIVQRRTNA